MRGGACVALFAMLFTACIDPASNNNDPYPNSYKPSVDTVGATYADVLFCTAEELQTLTSYEYFLYKESNTNSEYSSWNNDDNLSIKKSIYADKYSEEPLIPNTNYTLKITYTSKDYEKIERTITFKTKPYDFSSYKLQYDDIYDTVYIYTKELKVGDLKVYRSETADGEYSEIEIEGGAYPFLFCRDESDTLETDKTYYYKFKIFDSSSDKLLYESTTPLSIKVGVIRPQPINGKSLKVLQGITRVKFTWDEVDGADEYDIEVKTDSYYGDVLDTKTVTETIYEFDAIKYDESFSLSGSIDKKYEIRITAKNAGGISPTIIKSFYLYLPKISEVEVIPGQKEAQYICSTNIDYIPEGYSIEYALKEKSYSDNPIVSSTEQIFTRTGLNIDTEYNSYSSYYHSGVVYLDVTYMDKNGDIQSYTSENMKVGSFRTGNFDAVTNLEVLEEKTTSVKYKFSPLTTEQLNKQNVYYHVIAEDGITSPIIKKIDNPAAEYQMIEGLEAGREYSLKILVSSESSLTSYSLKNYNTFAEIKVITDSGLSKPTNIVLSEEESLVPTQPYLNVTWDKIAEDDGSGNVAYEIEYKVLKKSKFRKFIHEVNGEFVNAYINEYSAKMPVNAGNRYIVRVVAYKVDDTSSKVYSDEKVIQFSKFDDRSLATALLYPSTVDNAGDVIDFADPNVWNSLAAPKSSLAKGYNFGLTQFMGEAGTGLNFILPSGNPEYFAFKISFDGKDADNAVGIDSSYTPRLIFVDRNAFLSFTAIGKTYGEFSKIYIVIPDTEGYILETFEDDASDYLDENVNMPFFSEEANGLFTSTTSVQSAGLEINETWIYNNSVYVGVKQELAGNLGFSYFY